MTRVVCESGQPRRMETCGAEEPYEGNLHVRFCGGIGRVIADPTRTADAQALGTPTSDFALIEEFAMEAPSIIIPAFPYEGPLLWLLAPTYHLFASPEDLARDEYTGGSGYYNSLYGPEAGRFMHRAASLALVFDCLEFAPVDVALPDHQTFTRDGHYHHPDLKLTMWWNWPGWPDYREDYEFLKKAVINDQVIQALFRSDRLLPDNPDHQLSFVYRLLT